MADKKEKRGNGRNALVTAFATKDIRNKILVTLGILLLYRLGSYVPIPGIPFTDMVESIRNNNQGNGVIALLNMFSGGALSRMSFFSLGIMPYITAQIIMQMFQTVIPSLEALSKDGESGQRKITQYTRYMTILLATINSIGYLFLFKGAMYNIDFSAMGIPDMVESFIIVFTMVVGAIVVMWLGEVLTQHGIGNGMSLIIFLNIMAGLPTTLFSSWQASVDGWWQTLITLLVIIVLIPIIIFVERGQRRIPVQYAKRVISGGGKFSRANASYLPIKVNTAGVVPIIFTSSILYLPAQVALFFPNIEWLQTVANALASGWVNWVLSAVLIVFFAYFYNEMVFKPDEMAESLQKQGGYIPGVRPGSATAAYVQEVLDHVTLPGAIFMAALAVVPSIIFTYTSNQLIQAFGGTSILIMVGVALDTIANLESQVQQEDYDRFFRHD